jgi:hypothetical protein
VPCPERRDAQEIVVAGVAGSDPGSEPRVFRAGDDHRHRVAGDEPGRREPPVRVPAPHRDRGLRVLVAACTWRFAGYRREFLADLGDFEITATKTGPSPGTAASWAAFFTTAGCFTVKVVTPQQFQAYMAAQRTAQSSSGSTQ